MQDVSTKRVESLRLILEREQGREISHSEALEIGETFVRFFEVLAEGGVDGKEN